MTLAIVKSEPEAAQEAVHLRAAIEAELTGALGKEEDLSRSYVRLGVLLYQFREKEAWRALNYSGFNHFISEMGERFDRGRTMLFEYVSVVEKLLPQIEAEILEDIGISKARILKQAQKAAGGKLLPEIAIAKASNKEITANQLRTITYEAYDQNMPALEKGSWVDLGMYASFDEKEILKRAFRVAEKTDPVISKDLPDHIRRKEAILRWCMEYLASFEAIAERGQA